MSTIVTTPGEYLITPEVDQVQEFIEIANDFANPLELVREAISNAFDASATKMTIAFEVVKEYGWERRPAAARHSVGGGCFIMGGQNLAGRL